MGDFGTSLLIGLAAALGAIGGNFFKELLPTLAIEDWKLKRQLVAVFHKYRDPLILAATELVHRLDEIEDEFPPRFLTMTVKAAARPHVPVQVTTEDPYFQHYKLESSVYRLCAFLGWLELFRQDIVFLDSGKRTLNRQVDSALKLIRAALADGHLNEAPDWEEWRDALIFREEQRAIGEQMIVERGGDRVVMGYGAFCDRYRQPSGCDWFAVADRFLLDLLDKRDFRRFRLRLLTRGLIDLIEFLDPSRVSDRLMSIKARVANVA